MKINICHNKFLDSKTGYRVKSTDYFENLYKRGSL